MKEDGDGEVWRGKSLPIRAGVVITAVGMGREVGGIDQLEEVVDKYNGVIVSIGKNDTRRELIRRVQNINAPLISLIHPRAFVSPTATVGSGSIVLPGAVIHTNANIGIGCIVSIGALIEHDAVVEDFSHINTGAIVEAGKRAGGKVDAGQVVK